MTSSQLFREFSESWSMHEHRPWQARRSRWSRFGPLVLQIIGLHHPCQTPLFWGQQMRILTGETVSRSILAFGYAEQDLTALLCELVPEGATVVDIGTHFGFEAMLMAELVGPHGQVHAFEPNPEVAAYARRNLAHYPQASLRACALGETACRVAFHPPRLADSAFGTLGATGTPSTRSQEIAVARLDDEIPAGTTPVTLIKCDAEGYETAILRGAGRHLASCPALILETGMTEPGMAPAALESVMQVLGPLAYRAFCFKFDGVLRVAPQGTFDTGHASTLFLCPGHPRYAAFSGGWTRSA
jgi:FkbM family methyltransferase